MIKIKREGVLLESTDLYFENGGVLNPAVYQEGQSVHLLYRCMQNGGVSMLGYCRLDGPLAIAYRADTPFMVPEFSFEAYAMEDPRIVKIEDQWYLTYTAFDGVHALGALAISDDMMSFVKKGTVFPKLSYAQFYALAGRENINEKYFGYQETFLWNKNMMLFPRRIHGKLCLIHRIRPGIFIAEFDELSVLNDDFWTDYFKNLHKHILLEPLYGFEAFCIGGGCPPIETKEGWLLIYHGIEAGSDGYVYHACAALLDLDNPRKVIGRLPYALFSPTEHWEKYGASKNVVFPTGTARFNDRLYIYYGGADSCIATASINFDELLQELLDHPA